MGEGFAAGYGLGSRVLCEGYRCQPYGKVGEALMYIEKALELDPSLLETARVDGDIIDLLPEEQKIKNDNTTKE